MSPRSPLATSAQRKRRRQHRDESRQAILAAADRAFRSRPLSDVSVDELMAETGLTRTVFYRHFSDLPDLVLQLMRTIGGELMETSEDWVRDSESEPIGRESLRLVVEFFRRQGPLVAAVADAARYDDEIGRVYAQILDTFVDMTARALEDLVARTRIAPLDARETARALTFMNERYLLESFGRASHADPARVLDTLWTVWRRTVYAPPDKED